MSILALTSNTLIGTPAAGNVEYNGQFYGTDSAASRAQMQRITQGTAVASTSGTSIDFTSLPAWVKRITVMFSGVSTSGTSVVQVQLGSGSVTTSGYASQSTFSGASSATSSVTSGLHFHGGAAASARNGAMVIMLLGSNNWSATWMSGQPSDSGVVYGGGSITLSGTLDRVRITTVNGTDTFDAGSVNIMYEG
ncbi:hypothetical protein UFOVP588_55 [uncultured Caudovirales phage]|uniref:Uncharacterized protein n=1 Tax=uncultured Caudovirales phage TaxID=2100421 RepID=A0A6J5MZ50_9CAUD|nr:hypothetical protein UFOVP588_55 [uncultured Caudovirales phage]